MYFIISGMYRKYIPDNIGYWRVVVLTHYFLILHPKLNDKT
jgi:hypothetical protein